MQMRTKAKIRAMVERNEELKRYYEGQAISADVLERFAENIDSQNRGLRWVLGEEIPDHYFCSTCLIVHDGAKCPKCGNDNVL